MALEIFRLIPKIQPTLTPEEKDRLIWWSEGHFRRALYTENCGTDFRSVIPTCEQVAEAMISVGIEPTVPLSYLEYLEKVDYSEARDSYWEPVSSKSRIYALMGHSQKAIDVMKAAGVYPNRRIDVYLTAAEVEIRNQGNPTPLVDEALRIVDKINPGYLYPGMVRLYGAIGKILVLTSREDEAKTVFDKARDCVMTDQKNNGTENRWLSRYLAEAGLFDEALRMIDLVKDDDPKRRKNDILHIVTEQQIAQGHYAEALKTSTTWGETVAGCDKIQQVVCLGQAEYGLGHLNEAREYFTNAWYASVSENTNNWWYGPEDRARDLVNLARAVNTIGFDPSLFHREAIRWLYKSGNNYPYPAEGTYLLWGKWWVTVQLIESLIVAGDVATAREQLNSLPKLVMYKPRLMAKLAAKEYSLFLASK